MLPANVILTNRLINSSEAKDNSKVTQLAWHIWENMREILSRAGRVRSRFITTQPCLNVSLRPAIREMASSSVYVSSPWDELVVCLSTSVCLRFHLRNDSMCVCVCLCLAFFFLFSLHLLDSSSTHAPSFDSVLHDTVLWHLTFWPHSQTAITTPQSPAWTAI